MNKNSLRTITATVAATAMIGLGSGIAQAAPATQPAPPVATQDVVMSLPLVALFGPFAPFVAALACLPTIITGPGYFVCTV